MSRVKEQQTLKQLQTRLSKLESDKTIYSKDFSEAKSVLDSTVNKIKQVKAQIESLKEKELIVSEHAMLKYIERLYGVDLDELKGLILTDSLKQMAKMGDGRYPLDGCKAVVKGGVVVTILEESV